MIPEEATKKEQSEHITTSNDWVFGGNINIIQPIKGHRVGTDAVLLAASTPQSALKIADLGSSTGIIGLRSAQLNQKAQVTLLEKDEEAIKLAEQNIILNNLEERVTIRKIDALTLGKERDLREHFDCILTNPPFLSREKHLLSTNPQRVNCHHQETSLEDWVRNSVTILAPKGKLLLIHRADALEETLSACSRRFGCIRLKFIHSKPGRPAIRFLLCATKGSKAPITILPSLIIREENSNHTQEMAAISQGIASIKMD